MTPVLIILPILVGLLIVLSAALAASETAIFALTRMEHVREQMSRPIRLALERLMRRPVESLAVVIGINEVSNVFAECLATTWFLLWLGDIGAWVAAPVMLVIVLLFCDITPKTFALGYPAGIARITARPLAVLAGLLSPLSRWFGPAEPAPTPGPLSESEFKALLRLGEKGGEIEPEERAFIHRVFDFGARRAAEVMTPRDRIFALDVDLPLPQLTAEIAHGHFSRVPLYRGKPDNIVGILHAKDLVVYRLDSTAARADRLARPANFIPPNRPLAELFDEMRRGRFQMAMVVNEYGGLLGLVTLEDLLEELFGELRDEFDLDTPELQEIKPGEWMASGAIDIRTLNADLQLTPPITAPGAGRTLSAIVLRTLGRVPPPGETLRLGPLDARVERVRGATVELVRLTR